jgi:hypothetical protein
MFSTVDHLNKVACFVKKIYKMGILRALRRVIGWQLIGRGKWTTNCKGSLSTVDLLNKVGCFGKKDNLIFH